MAYLQLVSGARKRVTGAEACRCLKALKWPEKASEALREYVKQVKSVEFDPEVRTVQGALQYKEENREL